MRVQTSMGRRVVETENSAILDVLDLGQVVPGVGAVDGLAVRAERLSLVLQEPDVVFVLVGIKGDLLLLAAGGIHERVRVQVASLGVDVANGNTAAHDDIGRDILHSLVVERGLEFGAHKAVTVARVSQALEVDGEHGKIEGDGNDDEAKGTSHEMFGPDALPDCVSPWTKGKNWIEVIHTMDTFLVSPRRTQSWTRVKEPTQAMVNRPTHLMLTVMPRPRPVIASQNHQAAWKAFSGPSSCWFVKQEKARAVKAVAATRGESRRIRRAWVRSPFSVPWC